MWGKINDSFKPSVATAPTPERVQPSLGLAPVAASSPGPSSAAASSLGISDRPAARASASIGKTTRIRGEIYSEEDLFFDGEVNGSIEVRSTLNIGPNGKVKANVKAKELIVSGTIEGDVEAADRISIMNGASIVGDVKTAGIVIEDGAYFKGGIDILRPENGKAPAQSAVAGIVSAARA